MVLSLDGVLRHKLEQLHTEIQRLWWNKATFYSKKKFVLALKNSQLTFNNTYSPKIEPNELHSFIINSISIDRLMPMESVDKVHCTVHGGTCKAPIFAGSSAVQWVKWNAPARACTVEVKLKCTVFIFYSTPQPFFTQSHSITTNLSNFDYV